MGRATESVITEAFKSTFRIMVQKWKPHLDSHFSNETMTHHQIVDGSHAFLRRVLKVLELQLKEEKESSSLSLAEDQGSRFVRDLETCQRLAKVVKTKLETEQENLTAEESELLSVIFNSTLSKIKARPGSPTTH